MTPRRRIRLGRLPGVGHQLLYVEKAQNQQHSHYQDNCQRLCHAGETGAALSHASDILFSNRGDGLTGIEDSAALADGGINMTEAGHSGISTGHSCGVIRYGVGLEDR